MPKKIEEVGTIYTEIPNPAYPLSPDIIYELEYVCTKKYMYLNTIIGTLFHEDTLSRIVFLLTDRLSSYYYY